MEMVSVIVVNGDRIDCLRRCLDSVRQQSYGPLEAIVVDNGSSDGSQDVIRRDYLWARLIQNEENLLYCKAMNQGIKASKAKYVVCLNNDVVLEKSFLGEMVGAAESDDRIGMVCGRILSWDGRRIDSAGQILGRSRKPVDRGYREKDRGQYREAGYVFGAGGAAPLFRRRMLEDIKVDGEYFDESYGAFYEDLDICWRANLLGWRGFYVPQAVARHIRGGTAKVQRPRMRFLEKYDFSWLPNELKYCLLKNRYMTIIKNDSLKDILRSFPFMLAYEFKLLSWVLLFQPKFLARLIKERGCFKMALRRRADIRKKICVRRWE